MGKGWKTLKAKPAAKVAAPPVTEQVVLRIAGEIPPETFVDPDGGTWRLVGDVLTPPGWRYARVVPPR